MCSMGFYLSHALRHNCALIKRLTHTQTNTHTRTDTHIQTHTHTKTAPVKMKKNTIFLFTKMMTKSRCCFKENARTGETSHNPFGSRSSAWRKNLRILAPSSREKPKIHVASEMHLHWWRLNRRRSNMKDFPILLVSGRKGKGPYKEEWIHFQEKGFHFIHLFVLRRPTTSGKDHDKLSSKTREHHKSCETETGEKNQIAKDSDDHHLTGRQLWRKGGKRGRSSNLVKLLRYFLVFLFLLYIWIVTSKTRPSSPWIEHFENENFFCSDLRFLFDCELREGRFLYDSIWVDMVQGGDEWYLEMVEEKGKVLRLVGQTPDDLRVWHIATYGYLVPFPDEPGTYGIFRKIPRLDVGKGQMKAYSLIDHACSLSATSPTGVSYRISSCFCFRLPWHAWFWSSCNVPKK